MSRVEARTRTGFHVADEVQTYLDIVGAIVVALDRDGRIVMINESGCRILGVRSEDVRGKDWFEMFIPEADRPRVRWVFGELIEGRLGLTEYVENEVVTAAGERRMVAWHNAIRQDEAGEIIGTIGSGTDVTEQRRAERLLRESELRFRNLFERSPDGIFVCGLRGSIIDANSAACAMARHDRTDIVGLNIVTLFAGNDLERATAILNALVYGQLNVVQTTFANPGFDDMHVEIRSARMHFNGKPAATLHVRDISYRRTLESQVLHISEEERKRIGRDLHDEVGSLLTGAAMALQGLAGRARSGEPVAADQLEEIATIVEEGAGNAQAIAHGLNPVALEECGLQFALKELAKTSGHLAPINFSVDVDSVPYDVDPPVATQLYRIAQEAVANAIKHSQGTEIQIELIASNGTLRLAVADDGVGIRSSNVESAGAGLPTMDYRANLIGARLAIDNEEDGGTRVACVVPEPVALPRRVTTGRT